MAGWGPAPHPGIYAALLVVSAGLLTLEIAFTRLFSYTIWYHFAYLAISVALVGFGSSGAIVAAFPRLFRAGGERLLIGLLVAAAALVVLALVGLGRWPLELEDVLAAPARFSASLLCYYIVLAAPFVLAGFAVAVPFAAYPRLMGRLYGCDLLGAALGCLLAVGAVEGLGIPGLILIGAALLLAGAAALARASGAGAALLLAAVALAAGSRAIGDRVEIRVTSTKHVANPTFAAVLSDGDGRTDHYFKWTALSRVDAWGWDKPWKNYWGGVGVGKHYRGRRPLAADIAYDGGNGSNIFPFNGTFADYAMLETHVLRTPYLLLHHPRALVIGVGGGIDMLNAIKQGAQHVTGVELHAHTVRLLKERLRSFTGGFYDRDDVTLVASEGRHFVRKTTQQFDLIQITAVDTFAAQAAGAYVLAESYLYTVEAVRDYLARLSDDGVLAMVIGESTWSTFLPPLGTRLTLVARQALEEAGFTRPEDHLLVVAASRPDLSEQQTIVMVKKSPLAAAEVRTVRNFVTDNGFMALYAPPPEGPLALTALMAEGEAARRRELDRAWFRMDPVYDRSPFLYNVGKWRHFGSQPERSEERHLHFPGSFIGQLVLVLMLGQSLLLGVVLIVFPLMRGVGEGIRVRGVAACSAYFLALGLGFMFVEISFVQTFVLFLGSPTYALSVTIFALLLSSSLGSLLSARWVDRPLRALRTTAAALAVVMLLYSTALPRLFDACLHLDLPGRVLIALTAQLPMGLLLGQFMPLGIAHVSERNPRLVPWAWGINGVGSVVGTTLAVLLAMAWSFRVVSLIAIALYVAGVALLSLQPIGEAEALQSGAGGESKELAAVDERGSAKAGAS